MALPCCLVRCPFQCGWTTVGTASRTVDSQQIFLNTNSYIVNPVFESLMIFLFITWATILENILKIELLICSWEKTLGAHSFIPMLHFCSMSKEGYYDLWWGCDFMRMRQCRKAAQHRDGERERAWELVSGGWYQLMLEDTCTWESYLTPLSLVPCSAAWGLFTSIPLRSLI